MNGWYTIVLAILGTGGGTAFVAAVVERRKRGADVYATTIGASMEFVDRLQEEGKRTSNRLDSALHRLDSALMRIDEMELRENERDQREAVKDSALHDYALWAQQVTEALRHLDPSPTIPPAPRFPLERN